MNKKFMLVKGKHYRTIWQNPGNLNSVFIIDQTKLPFSFSVKELKNFKDTAKAIERMQVRGAPLIGVTAAFGIYLAALEARRMKSDIKKTIRFVSDASKILSQTRPTAVNLFWAIENSLNKIKTALTADEAVSISLANAQKMAEDDVQVCEAMGMNGLELFKLLYREKKLKRLNILTHCNAGWLATVDYGTATSPIYKAFESGMDLHVWVEETRPRYQGGKLTAWELGEMRIPHTIITDNAGGYVMQKGLVDVVITGSDRTTLNGDVCNKIGTYKTALAAADNNIPFFAAVPVSSFDFNIKDGINEIDIEERNSDEITVTEGLQGKLIRKVKIFPEKSPVKNFGFDITPSRLVTGLITERGIIHPRKSEIKKLK
jgi:methylthioribose-1-phosphate isomerase